MIIVNPQVNRKDRSKIANSAKAHYQTDWTLLHKTNAYGTFPRGLRAVYQARTISIICALDSTAPRERKRGTARNPRLSVANENPLRTPTAGRIAPRCIKRRG
jgi:hypothetical protein